MSLRSIFANRAAARVQRTRRTRSAIAMAAPSPLCESLESRWLRDAFVGHHWTGTTPTSARLEEGAQPREVDVFLNTNITLMPNFTFENTDGQDLVRTTLTNFTFIDKVTASLKPLPDLDGDSGIKVQSGSNGTLRIETGEDDTDIQVIESTSTSTIVQVQDKGSNLGLSELGLGVSNLTLRTNNAGGATVQIPFLTDGIHLTVDTGTGTDNFIFLISDIAEVVNVITGAGNCEVLVQESGFSGAVHAVVDFIGDASTTGNKLVVGDRGTVTLRASGSPTTSA